MSAVVPKKTRRPGRIAMGLAAALVLAAGVCLWARGRGDYTCLVRGVGPEFRVLHHPPRPAVMASRPADRDTNVLPDAFVAVDVRLPNSGKVVDATTLSEKTVRLYRTADKREVPAIVNTSGGGDDIVLHPS